MDSTSNQLVGNLPDKRVSRTLRTLFERMRFWEPPARIIATTATALTLSDTHAERVVLINSNSTVANTFTLPPALGTGKKFTLINNVTQTQGTVKFAADGTDVLSGVCFAASSNAASGSALFMTTATSDYASLNLTTTGGLGGDMFEAWDTGSGTWTVRMTTRCSGTVATPFAAT